MYTTGYVNGTVFSEAVLLFCFLCFLRTGVDGAILKLNQLFYQEAQNRHLFWLGLTLKGEENSSLLKASAALCSWESEAG